MERGSSGRFEQMAYEFADTPAISVGIWSRKGEFLGVPESPARSSEATLEHSRLPASGDSGEEGTPFTVHRFPGGYRVRVEERREGDEEALWLAPVEEGEESYMGLFSEEEVRELLPRFAVFMETRCGSEVGTSVARPSEPEQD